MNHFRHSRVCDQRGAATVEFALVSSVLLLMVLGILQYGFYFSDSLSLRAGVREAARMAAVQTYSCGDDSAQWSAFECTVKEQVSALTGDTHARVTAPEGWTKGRPLVVCAVVDSRRNLGLLPMPNNGYLVTKLRMSIEVDETAPTGTPSATADPSGNNWAWCA